MKSALGYAVLLFTFIGFTSAQARVSEDARKAILAYSLDMNRANQLLAAMQAMTQYLISLPDVQERVRRYATLTLEQQAAQVEKDPKAMDILKKNNLAAKDYIVGVPALRMALYAAATGKADNVNIVASPANIAFAKANLSVLKPKMDAADRVGAR